MEAGEFWTSSPVPQIKLTVMAATKGLISNKTTLSKVREVDTYPCAIRVISIYRSSRGGRGGSPLKTLQSPSKQSNPNPPYTSLQILKK